MQLDPERKAFCLQLVQTLRDEQVAQLLLQAAQLKLESMKKPDWHRHWPVLRK